MYGGRINRMAQSFTYEIVGKWFTFADDAWWFRVSRSHLFVDRGLIQTCLGFKHKLIYYDHRGNGRSEKDLIITATHQQP